MQFSKKKIKRQFSAIEETSYLAALKISARASTLIPLFVHIAHLIALIFGNTQSGGVSVKASFTNALVFFHTAVFTGAPKQDTVSDSHMITSVYQVVV